MRQLNLAAVLGSFFLLTCGAAVSDAAVFSVTSTNNSGPGSLRQAILDNNAAPGTSGPNSIEFAFSGTPPFVIRVQGQFLPPLKGPVVVGMKAIPVPATPAGGRGRGAAVPVRASVTDLAPTVVLDGSALVKPRVLSDCPGATFNYNWETRKWEASDVRGDGPNVRGYYGAGLAVQDGHDVEISGIEIRDFCAGVATVRSHDVYIHDVKIVDHQGAAGVIFTGDDGHTGVTSFSYNNRLVDSLLLDNGDGFEFTRGTHDSLLQGNYIGLTQPLPEDGNAVEFATAGDNNAVIGNTFTKYTDVAVTVGGNHHTIRDNKFISNVNGGLRASGAGLLIEGNTFTDNGGTGMVVGGAGTKVLDNVVTGSGGQGVSVDNATITLSRNSIFNNVHLGIGLAAPGGRGGGGGRGAARPAGAPMPSALVAAIEAAGGNPNAMASTAAGAGRGGPGGATGRGRGAGGAAPQGVEAIPSYPVLANTSKWTAAGIAMNGTLAGKPNERYAIEFFASRAEDRHSGDEHGWGEGEKYLGTAYAPADGSGKAVFTLPLDMSDPFGNGQSTVYFTATATDSAGSTSVFSRALMLTKGGH
jgi:3-dehydroshikimate dehydratase